ncbi:hypothetical protein B0I35DRAFT_640 [Stachybotrys elegans]|uniref:NACHT domain-containing protein n=1 Tax=Stachybotrys elegans TaxID=80388 RepID=A0A8K0T482_9HYPO|nr:hypothetical protein B0I35DRAFT_640 [Stachybotrys elegans]
MPSDTYHINASGNSFVHVGDNHQSEDTQHAKLLKHLLPNWESNKSLELNWDHNQAKQKHIGNTGEWVREHDKFQSWLCEPKSVLWFYGIAGCGKTVLSSTIIDYLRNSLSRESNHVAGYYFNAREDEKRNVARLIRSLILQLVPAKGKLPPQVEKICNGPGKDVSDDQLLLSLGELVEREGHTYIVIDALDECDASFRSGEESEVDKLGEFLTWLLGKSRNLHLLVTSRAGGLTAPMEQKLRSMMQNGAIDGFANHAIDLQSMKENIELDIKELVVAELKRWNARKGRSWLPLSKDRQDLVTRVVNEKADGMFRLAACLLDLVWRKGSWDQVERALNGLPSGLLEVYDRIFQDIDDQGQLETASILLRWLLYAERPLSLGELTEVTMIDAQGASFDIGNRAEDDSYVSLTLSSFVSISQDKLVQFAHQTVQEYLVSDKAQNGLFSHKAECHAWIARCCLTYMQFCAHRKGDCLQALGNRLPLFEYVSNNWYRHAWTAIGKGEAPVEQAFSSSAADCLRDCSLPVADDDPERKNAWELLYQWAAAMKSWLDQIACTQDAPHFSTLIDVACWGYERCKRALFTDLSPTDTISKNHNIFINIALNIALVGRYDDIIQIAFDGDLKWGWNETSWWAAEWDSLVGSQVLQHESHKAIIQVLLDYGVKVDSTSFYNGWTALHTAAFQGDEKVMRVLLSYGAKTSVRDRSGRTALHVASLRGHDAIVQLWLNEGLSFSGEDKIGWTALDRVLHKATIELVVQHSSAFLTVHGNSTGLESIQTLLDAEDDGRMVIPQVLQSNNNTIARTISLLLNARTDGKAEDTESPQLFSDEPTEPARSRSMQFETIDDENLTNIVSPLTVNKFVGKADDIILTGEWIKIGVSLMEGLLRGGQLGMSLFAPPFDSLQLRGRPRYHISTHVGNVEIYDGTADFIRSRIRNLQLKGGAANFAMSHVDNLMVTGGAANFTMCHINKLNLNGGAANFTMCHINNLSLTGGTAVFLSHTGNFLSSTVRVGQQEMLGSSVNFLTATRLSQVAVYDASAIFSSTAQLDQLEVHGGYISFSMESHIKDMAVYRGNVSFSADSHINKMTVVGGHVGFSVNSHIKEMAVYRGYVSFSMGSHIKVMMMYGGYVSFFSRAEPSSPVIYKGCTTFFPCSHIEYAKIHGGHVGFLSAARIDLITQYGGSLYFIHDILRELLGILLGGGGSVVDVEETDAETRATTASIQHLTMHGGVCNFLSFVKVEIFNFSGGSPIINIDGVMCLLASCGQDALARLLIDKGANPSEILAGTRYLLVGGGQEIVTSRRTALHEAAFRGQEAFVQMLLEKKADLCIQDDNGLTALQIATRQGHTTIVRLLEEEMIRADERNRVWGGGQRMLRKYAQGVYNALRFLTG